MIGIGIITLIGNIFNSSEAFLIDTCKAVAQAFCRCTIQTKAKSGLCLPFIAGTAQTVHNAQGKILAYRISVAYTLHQFGQLIKADIAKRNGRITIFQILVYCFALTQTGNSTILPMYRADIALNALQRIVTAHESFKAQLQTLIQQLPELLLIALGNNANLRQVQGNYALIEAAFKFIVTVFILPGRQEAAAAHRGENISFIVFTHFLSADVIRIHTLSAAFYCQTRNIIILAALQAVMLIQNINQLREGRGYINALIIFDALQTLTQNFFYNHSVFLQIRIILLQVQKQGNKRRLTIGGH